MKSKQIFEQALTIREKALGNNHPSLTESLEYLALINKSQGNYNKARDYYKKNKRKKP
jgi:tetratricopeptide (TPR) repeat protein